MRLELLGGMGIDLPGYTSPSISPAALPGPIVNYQIPAPATKPQTSVWTSIAQGINKIATVATQVKDTVSTVKQVFNPSGPVSNSQIQISSGEDPSKVEPDNTMLYVGLGVGGALLVGGVAAIVLKKKKKARALGKVRRSRRRKRT